MKRFLPLILVALLSACAATPKVAPMGVYQTEGSFEVTLEKDWSQWASSLNYSSEGEFLTKDGPLLNKLTLVTLEDGDTLARGAKDQELPVYTPALDELEVVKFISESLTRIGYTGVEEANIRPETLGGKEGVRFDLSGKSATGLKVQGDAAFVELADELNLILFIAPTMYYFGTYADEVDAVIKSMSFGDTGS